MIRAAVLVPAPDFPEEHDWAYQVEADALRRGGFDVEPRPWNDPGDLAEFDVVLPLVAWGYQSHPARWFALLDRLEDEHAVTLNPVSLLRWNSIKTYLEELAGAGVPTVPTRLVANLDEEALTAAREEYGEILVVKPPISAAAFGTYRVSPGDPIPPDAQGRAMMVQPFLGAVASEGEYSLIFFDGRFSHAVVKKPTRGDYRVQPHLGGREEKCDAPDGAIAVAQAALAAAPARPAYARVDLIRRNDGQLAVIELELIEPSLWLEHSDDDGASFAAAIRKALND